MKLRSLTLATLFAIASLAPLGIYERGKIGAIRERLEVVKIDGATGIAKNLGVIEVVTLPSDGNFVRKAALARAMIREQLPWWAKGLEVLAPRAANALVVNAGETALRDCFIATSCTTAQSFKFHGLGSGSTAAAETDTTCETEFTTQYNPDSTRATGSQTNNGANVYRTVGTNTVDASATARNFCLMSAASGGTIWSHIVFGADIGLASGDGVQTTYDLTIE